MIAMRGPAHVRRALCSILALAALTAAPARAVPPPPAPVPPGLSPTIDGYDVHRLFELWRYWVEAQKGAAVETLLSEPETFAGEQAFGAPFLCFVKSNDFGRFLVGEVRSYCRPAKPYGPDQGSCRYRLRRAYIPHDAASYGADNPISAWTRDRFDAPALVRHLRASGFAPDTDWWAADKAKLFAALPSPVPVLIEHATVARLDSRDCPAFAQAIAAVDSRRADLPLDFYAVGPDAEVAYPAPHAISVVYTLRTIAPGGRITIEGDAMEIEASIKPILDAADSCEAARRQ